MILGTTHRLVPVYYQLMQGTNMFYRIDKARYEFMNDSEKKYISVHYDLEEMDHREFFNTPD